MAFPPIIALASRLPAVGDCICRQAIFFGWIGKQGFNAVKYVVATMNQFFHCDDLSIMCGRLFYYFSDNILSAIDVFVMSSRISWIFKN